MCWPQASRPFQENELRYIASLDGQHDAKLLEKKLGIRRECCRLLEVTTTLLKVGAANGLTLYDIGSLMCRSEETEGGDFVPSPLERIVSICVDTALARSDSQALSSPQALCVRSCTNRPSRVSARRPSAKGPRCERLGRDAGVGIFARPGLPANEWSQSLEKTFRRHLQRELEASVARLKSRRGGA